MEKQTRSILAILSTDIPGYTEKNEEGDKRDKGGRDKEGCIIGKEN